MNPLYIHGWGAVTPVGLCANSTAAAIRAGVIRVEETVPALPPDEPQMGAVVRANRSLKRTPREWLANLARRAIGEALEDVDADAARIALLLAPPEPFRRHPGMMGRARTSFLRQIESSVNRRFHPASHLLDGGAAGVFDGLRQARELLADRSVQLCLVGGVDSLVNRTDLDRLRATDRLRRKGVPKGLVPSEGASFVLVGARPDSERYVPLARILGVGSARERQSVLGPDYSVGAGFRSALVAAAEQAGGEELIEYVVSTFNGERYAALEALIYRAQVYRSPRRHLATQFPASCVGELGAAGAAVSIIVAGIGIARQYSPGQRAMCEAAADEGERAGVVIGPSPMPPAFLTATVRRKNRR